MNAVGIDVSKGKSMVAILRSYGELVEAHFEVKHTSSEVQSLIQTIQSIDGESRIVMEHTGRYYEPLFCQLAQAGFFVTTVKPKLIKDFGTNSLRKVKSDKADAIKIAKYALDSWSDLKQYNVMDKIRKQLKTMNRQLGFYMKHTTSMKNNFIGLLDQTFPGVNNYFSSPVREDGSQKWVDFATTYCMWTASETCPVMLSSAIIKTGASARSITFANQRRKKSTKQQRNLFRYSLRTM